MDGWQKFFEEGANKKRAKTVSPDEIRQLVNNNFERNMKETESENDDEDDPYIRRLMIKR